ncbi:MAG: site-2 protease family protein [Parcubacteria group bacterium]|nr:site-2 protease family protein [Parcubacteria group bacterium]
MESIFYLVVLVFSVVIHEVSHGYAARAQGDETAERSGRLSLNPLKHLDPFGSVILPLMLYFFSRLSGVEPVLFGWAKPVPYNPVNLRNQRWGPTLVALAGPGANITLALLFGLAMRFFPTVFPVEILALFTIIIITNLMLGVFNLVPIPPLDGSKVLFGFLPWQYQGLARTLETYGPVVLLFFIFFGFQIIIPAILFLFQLFTGGSFSF